MNPDSVVDGRGDGGVDAGRTELVRRVFGGHERDSGQGAVAHRTASVALDERHELL